MKSFLFITSLILTFCAAGFAQTNETLPCPTVEVIGPAKLTISGEVITFESKLDENYKSSVKYDWEVSVGTIVEGQGSPIIRIATIPEMAGEIVTATVKMSGLPENCTSRYSGSAMVSVDCILPLILDEYGEIPSSDEKARISNVAEQLKSAYKDDALVFSLFFKVTDSEQSIKKRILKISDQLTQKHQLSKEKFSFVLVAADETNTQITLSPINRDEVGKSWQEQLKELKSQK